MKAMVIAGPAGYGKTTMAHAYANLWPNDCHVCVAPDSYAGASRALALVKPKQTIIFDECSKDVAAFIMAQPDSAIAKDARVIIIRKA